MAERAATTHALPPRAGWPAIVGSALSLAGLADTAWLTYAHFTTAASLVCPDTGVVNCEKVTTSSYSELFGHIPVALVGLAFFAAMVVLQSPWGWRQRSRLVRTGRLAALGAGVAMVLWLLYAELFRLGAICLYCSVVHGLTVALFVSTVFGTLVSADEEPGRQPADAP